MNGIPRCSRAAVRRLLLNRSLLTQKSTDDVLSVIRKLECVQLDPVAAVERNQHLVLGARVKGYRPQSLNRLLETGQVFEYIANAACVIPVDDYPAVQAIRRRHEERLHSELDKYPDVVHEVLSRLSCEGALPSSAFSSEDRVHGYWDNTTPKTKATSHVLNLLNDVGTIRVVKREGNIRHFDLARHSLPSAIWELAQTISTDEAERLMLEKYMRAYRVFDLSDSRFGWAHWNVARRRNALEPYLRSGEVVPIDIQDCKTQYYVLEEDVEELLRLDEELGRDNDVARFETGRAQSVDISGRDIRFLPPLDNLLWRRSRIVDLFGFDYKWEIYTPAVKRTYGYYAMPILAGDRLIGRVDPRLDRKQKTLSILGLAIEPTVKMTKKLQHALSVALMRFAKFHGATEVVWAPDSRKVE